MKKPVIHRYFAAVLLLLLFTLPTIGQSTAVTFQVNMGGQSVSSNGVHIAGDFQSKAGLGSDWTPGSTRLSDADGDGIFNITVRVPSGTYEYKFINGNAWGMDENPPNDCSVGNTNNRRVSIGSTDLVLPAVPYNGCAGNSIKLSVNMSGQTISPNGIHVMGDFQKTAGFAQDWDPTSIALSDLNRDKTYEVSLNIPKGDYQYLFVNGNNISEAEVLPTDCAEAGANGTNNRIINLESDTPDPPVFCFDSCEMCDPSLSTDFKTHWWNDAVFYELFVRSFYDSDGDGIGDFKGIIEKLDYLNDGNPDTDTDLGITAIWLMPMMESPSYHGYDVTDYYKTEPDYGTMADFELFLDAAHERGIKVIIDLVLNHTSNEHPWFTKSASGSDGFRDWYVWSNSNPGFQGPWGQGVWHGSGSANYYGLFWSGMPDLNYTHPPVKEEMFKVADFWLDKGVDGFRLDAIKYLIEEGTNLENTPATFSLLEEFNDVYEANNTTAFSVGEVWSSTSSIIPYVQNERLDVCFEFDLASDIISAVNNGNPNGIQQQMQNIQASYPALQYGTFLTNHDMDRVFNQIGSDTDKMKLAASIYLTLPGIPFLYYGEEINMKGTGDHENIRQPMQWSAANNAGFSSNTPWNSVGINYINSNVAAMESDSSSLLNHYKKLIHIRNQQVALRRGNYLNIASAQSGILSYVRIHKNEGVVVVSNLSTQTTTPSLTLAASSLSPGEYMVKDLVDDSEIGSVSINSNGGFDNWQPASVEIAARSSRMFLLSTDNSVSTSNVIVEELNFQISPNPTKDEVNINCKENLCKDASVNIISNNGITAFKGVMYSESLTLSTSNWSKGIYYVHLSAKGKKGIKRLVIL